MNDGGLSGPTRSSRNRSAGCHRPPVVAALALALALSGCATAPGASALHAGAQRMAGVVDFTCETLDGAAVRITVDVGAALTGQTVTVALLRAVRQAACAGLGYRAPVAPEPAPALST